MRLKTSILVVDDNPSMAETTADILTLHGYRVHLAFSGVEALGVLKREDVQVLLTDVIMPDMDGVTLYRLARKNNPRLIGFLMTAYADSELIQQGIDEGVSTVLSKPVDIPLLLNLIQAVVQTYFS